MVGRSLVLAVLASLAVVEPAAGQSVDWSRSGGDLFGRVRMPDAAELPPDRAAIEPVLAPLAQPFGEIVRLAAERHGLDPKLLHAVIVVESAYRTDARSPVGAGGLTQLMPATALELGVTDRFDPVQNVGGGADYLARQMLRFGDVRLALAAYNAGPARVARLGRIPEIAETRAYVVSVIECFLALTAGRGVTNARQCAADAP